MVNICTVTKMKTAMWEHEHHRKLEVGGVEWVLPVALAEAIERDRDELARAAPLPPLPDPA